MEQTIETQRGITSRALAVLAALVLAVSLLGVVAFAAASATAAEHSGATTATAGSTTPQAVAANPSDELLPVTSLGETIEDESNPLAGFEETAATQPASSSLVPMYEVGAAFIVIALVALIVVKRRNRSETRPGRYQ